MTEKEKNTEDRIIEAAKEIFVAKGMEGARMQEIADRAGINKSLLHYYFRSKEKLFDYIFIQAAGKIGDMVGEIMTKEYSVEEKIRFFTLHYSELLQKNPFLPNFIISELTRNPEILLERFSQANIEPSKFFEPLRMQLLNEGYHISPQDFIVNLLSLVIFPIVAKPILENKIFGGDSKAYQEFIDQRKVSIANFYLHALEAYKITNNQ
ncbi:MAG TPA: TetR/AcrR family transcriptional regulator [Marinilabiliales bacterium]|jgi:AcrR family transcriptional regulator|nr:MAG: hypothetical protein A2W95_05355 [Bacteroidetes bacterium GWA2_40_14]OFX59892.1 MAG: hypothetical protein A2W84_02115 [Bacteroidetes bacterium GWC2_40_13]OFX75115.1 MAG: hypothetical protein A2W96_17125 [Bacteroidetes bacterium GWD2_40_43]OFX93836.1 MAG: hypothetical protein A2W97_00260 [Bacteroidetes bacterium GWE2_40_63]OFY18091.1 MAG: hypothetical protein A2W88_01070 [Bacteroidetes bacterium GWF2_40_13]OFZ27298.1 MAG: hypothetical protein A2437_13635 [Bacteroidetes bacterium RIFOXYC